MDARVRVKGHLHAAADHPPCQLFLVEASDQLKYGRDIRGGFVEWFTVHPWGGPYRAVVKCGDRIALSKDIAYREFGADPYDLGRIAL